MSEKPGGARSSTSAESNSWESKRSDGHPLTEDTTQQGKRGLGEKAAVSKLEISKTATKPKESPRTLTTLEDCGTQESAGHTTTTPTRIDPRLLPRTVLAKELVRKLKGKDTRPNRHPNNERTNKTLTVEPDQGKTLELTKTLEANTTVRARGSSRQRQKREVLVVDDDTTSTGLHTVATMPTEDPSRETADRKRKVAKSRRSAREVRGAKKSSSDRVAHSGSHRELGRRPKKTFVGSPRTRSNRELRIVGKGGARTSSLREITIVQEGTGNKLNLEDQVYYHGFRPWKDVVNLLSNPGDFLIRAATETRNRSEFVLSILNDKRDIISVTLRSENGTWVIGARRKSGLPMPHFLYIDDLICYYKEHRLPGHSYLRRGVPRPAWVIKHENVVFDRTKDLLGTGNFCHVYKGIYYRTPEEKMVVAIKICHEGHGSDKEFEETKDARDQMLEEAQMMSYYVHSHIVELYGVACGHPPVLIVMEYCPGGNLEVHLKSQKDSIEVGERIIFALEASRGMLYLHRKNCIHRDLAARNCLISAKGLIKISDFGLSKMGSELEKMDGVVPDEPDPQIPLRWMAPESLRRPMKFSTKTDVWSFGVMMFEIFNQGEKPWMNEPAKKIATMIRRCQMPTFPDTAPKEISDLASRIWVIDPQTRPSMKDVSYSLVSISKAYPAPAADQFSLNKLTGVKRTDTSLQYSLEDTADCDEEIVDGALDDTTMQRPSNHGSTKSYSTGSTPRKL